MWQCPQVDNEFKEYDKNIQLKLFEVMKFMSKNHIQPIVFEHHF